LEINREGGVVNEFFGLSMNYIMFTLLVILAVALGTVLWAAVRNRVMFMAGVRNIPRRRAQTVLIILGVMLSTLIISAAFSVGDTFDYSITKLAYDRLHNVDELVQAQRATEDEATTGLMSIASPRPIPESEARQLADTFRALPGVDGAVMVARGPVPATSARSGLSEPQAVLSGVAAEQMQGFTDIESLDGRQLDVGALGPDEIYANESAADSLDLRRGDIVTIFTAGQPHDFTVTEIVKDRELSGSLPLVSKGFVTSMARAQELLGRPGLVDVIAVSNAGGVRDSVAGTSGVMKELDSSLLGSPWQASDTKRAHVDEAKVAASQITAILVMVGSFSIAAGMLLIFMIFVMLAAERKTEMGISRAVGAKRRQLIDMFMSEGMVYNLLASLAGCALGVAFSVLMVRVMALLFAAFDISIVFHVSPRSLVVSYSIGVVLTFLTVTFSSWRVSKLNIVAAIRDMPEPAPRKISRTQALLGAGALAAGAALTWAGWVGRQSSPFGFGITTFIAGMALVARYAGVSRRLAFSGAGALLLAYWLAGAGGDLPFDREMSGGWEMFLLSGIALIAASTFILIYNADLLLGALALAGRAYQRLLPSVIMAVAYPMASRFRTGMTIAMIALVVFSIVVMSAVQSNFNSVFNGKEALGGYDVLVTENPSNPVPDLAAALRQQGYDTSAIAGIDTVQVASRIAAQLRNAPKAGEAGEDFSLYPVYGLTESFNSNNQVRMRARARGLATDADGWRSVHEQPDEAVIDGFSIASDFQGYGGLQFSLAGISSSDATFDPIPIEVRDASTGATRTVKIVGIEATEASAVYYGLYMSQPAFTEVFGKPDSTAHLVRLRPGSDAREAARGIEKTLTAQGVQADSIRKLIDDQLRVQMAFLYLIQGFMGLGLLVGIAAVGVISFRAVVERRQQIGVLRAIGFARWQVALSFVMESSFMSLLGVASGIALGLLLSDRLLLGDAFEFGFRISTFAIPWTTVASIAVFAITASVVMTIIPSMRASRVPVAEAMRYE